MRRALSLTVVSLLLLAGCGSSEPEGPNVSKASRTALRATEPDLQRLAQAVTEADAGDKASLIGVQAAAQRASQSLSDARADLRNLADKDGVSEEDVRKLREKANAVADLQGLADVLAAPKLSSPRIEAALALARLAQDDLSVDVDVPAINANLLVDDLRKVRQEDAEAASRKAADKRRKDAAKAQTGQPSRPVGSGSSSSSPGFSYFIYTGPAFQASLPTGAGWGSPSESQPTPGRLFRTNVRGPNGLFVIIDYTPLEAARFGGSASSQTVVGQTAFGSAVRYEFQGGRIPECQSSRCVDYIINDQSTGSGFAVLAGGGAGSADIARRVAQSVVPTNYGE